MSRSSAQSTDLSEFFALNARWAQEVTSKDPHFFENSAKSQAPKMLWIGCADSRVPESVIMASMPGVIFTHRNIVNQFHLDDDSALSVLAYAVEHLGVEHVVVAGHTVCGGAIAAYEAAKKLPHGSPPPCATPLERWLAPLTKYVTSSGLVNKPQPEAIPLIVEANVRNQVANLLNADPITHARASGKPVHVHGWVYDLKDGRLRDLHVSGSPAICPK